VGKEETDEDRAGMVVGGRGAQATAKGMEELKPSRI